MRRTPKCTRLEDCPLVPVPTHGRLIKAEGRNLHHLDRLEEYLKRVGVPYERIDAEGKNDDKNFLIEFEQHQICVPTAADAEWAAICHRGSYGCEEGLLEIYGTIVSPSAGDSVEGWLTAEDVISRYEDWNRRKG